MTNCKVLNKGDSIQCEDFNWTFNHIALQACQSVIQHPQSCYLGMEQLKTIHLNLGKRAAKQCFHEWGFEMRIAQNNWTNTFLKNTAFRFKGQK